MLKRTITGIGIVIVTVGFFLCKYFLDMPVFEGVFLKPVTVGDMLFDLFILIMAVISTYEYERAFSDKLLKTEKVIIFFLSLLYNSQPPRPSQSTFSLFFF